MEVVNVMPPTPEPPVAQAAGWQAVAEVFSVFLKLGCLAFGGPVAHLAYFQHEFVERRRWLDAAAYADLVALCQFLPGPASSQVGFALGLRRAGIAGAFAAWLAFTLPSAALMIAFAAGLTSWGAALGGGWIDGLKLAAVAVVAQAIWSMAAQLCPDRPRALIALGTAAMLAVLAAPGWQVVAIVVGAVCGLVMLRAPADSPPQIPLGVCPQRFFWLFLLLFGVLLIGLPVAVTVVGGQWLAVFEAFYRAGALVFGGGHVVLPLLDGLTVGRGWLDSSTFIAGYGAAQSLPGPLFAFSAFLGSAIAVGPGGVVGGVLALVAIYVPSWLLVLGAIPYWERIRAVAWVRPALMGTNAAVVGLLIAAFFNPIWSSTIVSAQHFAGALVAFALLRYGKVAPWLVVAVCAAAGCLLF
jgi:chromate transporter